MREPVNLTILHENGPERTHCWRSFSVSENSLPVCVCASHLLEEILEEGESIETCYDIYVLRRLDILKRALTVAQTCPVILYTGLVADDVHAPCGCYGYDSVCDYHRHGEDEVAECFCSETLNLKCSYHATLHHD